VGAPTPSRIITVLKSSSSSSKTDLVGKRKEGAKIEPGGY